MCLIIRGINFLSIPIISYHKWQIAEATRHGKFENNSKVFVSLYIENFIISGHIYCRYPLSGSYISAMCHLGHKLKNGSI